MEMVNTVLCLLTSCCWFRQSIVVCAAWGVNIFCPSTVAGSRMLVAKKFCVGNHINHLKALLCLTCMWLRFLG